MGVRNFLIEREDKSEKGGLMQKWVVATRVCWESKVPFITFRNFSLLSQPFKIVAKSLLY